LQLTNFKHRTLATPGTFTTPRTDAVPYSVPSLKITPRLRIRTIGAREREQRAERPRRLARCRLAGSTVGECSLPP